MILSMNRLRLYITTLCVSILINFYALGDTFIIDKELDESINISHLIKLATTKSDFPKTYKVNNEQSIHINYTQDTIWMRVDIENKLQTKLTRYLYFTSGLVGDLSLYKLVNQQWVHVEDRFISELELTKGFFPQFKLHLSPQSSHSFLIKRKAMHHFDTKIYLSPFETLREIEKKFEMFYILYIGIIFTLIFYHLTVFFFTKDLEYLTYCLFMLSISTTLLILNNFFEGFLKIPINNHLGFFSSLSILAAFLFAYIFLNLREKFPKVKYYLIVNIIVSMFCMVANLTPFYSKHSSIFGVIVDLNIAISIFIIMGISIKLAFKNVLARIYVLSWIFVYTGALAWFAVYLKILPLNFFTNHSILIGNVLEALILALALAYKIGDIRKEAIISQQRAKDREKYLKLVRVLSHDMANSLFIITGFLKLYKKRPHEFEMAKVWSKIEKATNHMQDILNSVKLEQALEKDGKAINLEPVDIEKVMTEVIEIFDTKIRSKNINMMVSFQDHLPYALANRSLLTHQILSNILSNAIKYSHQDSNIEISVKAIDDNIQISIQDYGVGIEKKVLDKINRDSDIFSSIGTSGEKGTGFGLYITKSYVKMLKGSIVINSRDGKSPKSEHCGTLIKVTFLSAKQNNLS